MDEFRNRVTDVGFKATEILESFLDGKATDPEALRYASKLIETAVKIESLNQNRDLGHKRLAMGLLARIPMDEEMRKRYIELTNPASKAPLLGRPTD